MENELTLRINADLKFIEFILGSFDDANNNTTVGFIKEKFREKFKCDYLPLINQHFGIIRLIPLMHMVESKNNLDESDAVTLKSIRNAFAHNTIQCDENGYQFLPNRNYGETISISYIDFVPFIHRIENAFYTKLF